MTQYFSFTTNSRFGMVLGGQAIVFLWLAMIQYCILQNCRTLTFSESILPCKSYSLLLLRLLLLLTAELLPVRLLQ